MLVVGTEREGGTMRKTRGSRRGAPIIGFILGAVTGGVVALLSAPASGRVTRRLLTRRARIAERRLERQLSTTRRQLIKRAEHSCEAATDWISARVLNGQARRPSRVTNGHTKPRRAVRRVLRHA